MSIADDEAEQAYPTRWWSGILLTKMTSGTEANRHMPSTSKMRGKYSKSRERR